MPKRKSGPVAIPIYHAAAFAAHPFTGNPAAVCILSERLPKCLLQAIAAENSLPATVFVRQKGGIWHVRWFSPSTEIQLCGHGALAAAHVLLEVTGEADRQEEIILHGKYHTVRVSRNEAGLTLHMPLLPPSLCIAPPAALEGLGVQGKEIWLAENYLVRVGTEEEVQAVKPDFATLSQLSPRGVILTAPGEKVDFVSRFFIPGAGIDEDAVTGSAHCTLFPYWAERLGRRSLCARQLSQRGGEIYGEIDDTEVRMTGKATLFMKGQICLPNIGDDLCREH